MEEGIYRVRKNRLAAQLQEHFIAGRPHARALASAEDHGDGASSCSALLPRHDCALLPPLTSPGVNGGAYTVRDAMLPA